MSMKIKARKPPMTKAEMKSLIAVLALKLVKGTKLKSEDRPGEEYTPKPGDAISVVFWPSHFDSGEPSMGIPVLQVPLRDEHFALAEYAGLHRVRVLKGEKGQA